MNKHKDETKWVLKQFGSITKSNLELCADMIESIYTGMFPSKHIFIDGNGTTLQQHKHQENSNDHSPTTNWINSLTTGNVPEVN